VVTNEFIAHYEAYFGDFPGEMGIRAHREPWESFISTVRDYEISNLLDQAAAVGSRGKPRLGQLKQALAVIRPQRQAAGFTTEHGSADLRLSETPLWDCSADPPTMRRKIFYADLPSCCHAELKKLMRGVTMGRITAEECKALAREWWKPKWEDYDKDEQAWARADWKKHESKQARGRIE